MDIYDYCFGCESHELPIKEDHSHQYINMRGNATTCWWIDGMGFTKLDDAIDKIKDILECNTNEALKFISSLPMKIG